MGKGQSSLLKMVLVKNVSVSNCKPIMGNDHYFVEYEDTHEAIVERQSRIKVVPRSFSSFYK